MVPSDTRLERASETFAEVVRCLHFLHRPEWEGLDLTMAQFKTLMLVASTGGLSARELAHRLGIGPSAVTPVVDKLVQHGYARREEDAVDRRISWTRPTDAGLALFEKVNAAGREGMEEVLRILPRDELAVVERALEALRGGARRLLDERARGVERG